MAAADVRAVSQFDTDTDVVADGDGFRADITHRWDNGGKPNGGYLLSTVVRAAGERAQHPDPLTVTAHYLRPTDHGPAELTAEAIRTGRQFDTVVSSLAQGGKERIRAIATFGRLSRAEPTLHDAPPPALPPPEELTPLLEQRPPGGFDATPEVISRFDVRLDPAVGWPTGGRSGRAEITGWIRFADGREPDALSLPLFADVLPPAMLDVVDAAWVPTLELTVHVRAEPAPGWLLTRFRTRVVRGGILEEDGELWDSTGNLVAMSRQLALLLQP